jgi:hypothetical protein
MVGGDGNTGSNTVLTKANDAIRLNKVAPCIEASMLKKSEEPLCVHFVQMLEI